MSSITTLNQTILNICTGYIFQSFFFRENIVDFTNLHNKKTSIWKFGVNVIVWVIGTRVKFTKFCKPGSPIGQ